MGSGDHPGALAPENPFWADALQVACLLATDPAGFGGVRIRSAVGPVRSAWLDYYQSLADGDAPLVKIPVTADSDRIIGGVDLSAALHAGRIKTEPGLLSKAHGGAVAVAMAERAPAGVAGLIAQALDEHEVTIERAGVSRRDPARIACILLDEGIGAEEAPPAILLERLAFHIFLDGVASSSLTTTSLQTPARTADDIAAARERLPHVSCSDAILEAMAQAAARLGVGSPRALLFALRAARALAALEKRKSVTESDAETACRLVFGPRAIPYDAAEQSANAAPPPEPELNQPDEPDRTDDADNQVSDKDLEELLVAATKSAALGWTFARPQGERRDRRLAGAGGKSGALIPSLMKGRPVSSRRGTPRDGARLDISATLRAAAPWRKIRPGGDRRVLVPIYKDDLRIKRFVARSESLVIFAVDASGSAAMHRMAEAKGAVEHLLADCYSRRDHVALIAFRGERADLLFPPTRSLTRVRRSLTGLPGGGGTPLASGVVAAHRLAESEQRKGKTPFIVFLSDGRGNIALDGAADRGAAFDDGLAAGERLRAAGYSVLFFDTGARPSEKALALSEAMGARYLPLPFANSKAVSDTVKRTLAAE
ncbi:MAG: magnesium chelatase subunit D [Pseudomonadota bacterium]